MLIVANWKCNPTNSKKVDSLLQIKEGGDNAEVVICPPFLYLSQVKDSIKNKNIKLGAQDCFWENEGSYTGEVSPLMLSNLDCEYVIVGHSERRKYFKEGSVIINKKIKKALENNLKVILCVGETEKEREESRTFEILKEQIKKALNGIEEKVIIAYEPLWAIGSGNNCEPEEAEKVAEFIKEEIDTKVLYGGSVDKSNASYYLDKKIDGLLIGGASLDSDQFSAIINMAKE